MLARDKSEALFPRVLFAVFSAIWCQIKVSTIERQDQKRKSQGDCHEHMMLQNEVFKLASYSGTVTIPAELT